jgi:hypothetical protein
MHRALFPMKRANTKTIAAIDVENWLTHPLAIQFSPPVSVGFVFGGQESWAALVYEGNQIFVVFRVRRVLSQKESHPTMRQILPMGGRFPYETPQLIDCLQLACRGPVGIRSTTLPTVAMSVLPRDPFLLQFHFNVFEPWLSKITEIFAGY